MVLRKPYANPLIPLVRRRRITRRLALGTLRGNSCLYQSWYSYGQPSAETDVEMRIPGHPCALGLL